MNDKTPRGVLQLTLLIEIGEAYLDALKQSLLDDVPHPSVARLKAALDVASHQFRYTGRVETGHLVKMEAEMELWRATRSQDSAGTVDGKLDHTPGSATAETGYRRKLDS